MTNPFVQFCSRFIRALHAVKKELDRAMRERSTGGEQAPHEPMRFECTMI